jgi:hypothetical protein
LSCVARSSSVALLFDVTFEQLEELAAVGRRCRADIDLGHRLARHDVRGLRADACRRHAADVQRRVLQRLLIGGTDFLGLRDADALAQRRLVVTDAFQARALCGR